MLDINCNLHNLLLKNHPVHKLNIKNCYGNYSTKNNNTYNTNKSQSKWLCLISLDFFFFDIKQQINDSRYIQLSYLSLNLTAIHFNIFLKF